MSGHVGGGSDVVRDLREKAQLILVGDHFNALGITRNASADAVGRAFVQAAKTWHPDRAPAAGGDDLRQIFAKVFARLDLARATLLDPTRRAKYIDELSVSDRPLTGNEMSAAEAQLEYRKAEALLKKNDVVGAVGHLQRATKLAPSNATYQAALIALQAQKPGTTSEQLAKFAAELDHLIGFDAKCERAFFYRAQIRKRLNRLEEANSDFKRAVELDPSNVEAQREVRIFEMRKNNSSRPPPPPDEGGGFFRKLFKR